MRRASVSYWKNRRCASNLWVKHLRRKHWTIKLPSYSWRDCGKVVCFFASNNSGNFQLIIPVIFNIATLIFLSPLDTLRKLIKKCSFRRVSPLFLSICTPSKPYISNNQFICNNKKKRTASRFSCGPSRAWDFFGRALNNTCLVKTHRLRCLGSVEISCGRNNSTK